jgi:hypothetical protein
MIASNRLVPDPSPKEEPKFTWKNIEPTPIERAVQEYINELISSNVAAIEKRKDKLNFAPAIEFVESNLWKYQEGIQQLLWIPRSEEANIFANTVDIVGHSKEVDTKTQLTPKECRDLLARIPDILRKLSHLKTISYDYNGAGYRIHIPVYSTDGSFSRLAHAVRPTDFPRKLGNTYEIFRHIKEDDGLHYKSEQIVAHESDHPTRFVVGISNWATIYPTAIPKSIGSSDTIKMYQTGVFLHEFFHTIELPHRSNKASNRNMINLQYQWDSYTLQDWWKEWEDLYLTQWESQKSISYYASTYTNNLLDRNDPLFEFSLAEQIAESFVAYMLNIQANSDGWTDFRAESFGNQELLKEYQDGKSLSANKKWLLMNKLCNSTLVKN